MIDTCAQRPPNSSSNAEAPARRSEQGGGSSGQAYLVLPETERRAVREEVRRSLLDTGGPIAIEVELRFASGHR